MAYTDLLLLNRRRYIPRGKQTLFIPKESIFDDQSNLNRLTPQLPETHLVVPFGLFCAQPRDTDPTLQFPTASDNANPLWTDTEENGRTIQVLDATVKSD